jgi:hypothetical protein
MDDIHIPERASADPNLDQIRQLARELDCFTEDDLAALTKTEISTLRNWRSRRFGPPFCTLGNVVLYPIQGSREWISKNAEATLPANAAFEHLPPRGGRARKGQR